MGASGIRSGSGSAATLAALQCLFASILISLSDRACADIILPDAQLPVGGINSLSLLTSPISISSLKPALVPSKGQQQSSSQQALEVLRRMSSQHASSSTSSPSPSDPAGQTAVSVTLKQSTASAPRDIPSAEQRLRVERSEEWVVETATRVCGVLKWLLPPLTSHPRTAVRQALVTGK